MAFWTKSQNSFRPSEKGQGTVEALITLPAFLVLSAVLFQTVLLCMGQIILQYAVFCTVRTGVVTDGDLSEMNATARAVLSPISRRSSSEEQPFRVEVLSRDELLQVRIIWNYPLIVPYAETLLKDRNLSASSGSDSTIPLSASWTLPMEQVDALEDRREHLHAEL